jgi:hypothetical protein
MDELKNAIRIIIAQMFSTWDFSDIERVYDSICDEVAEDVRETSNYTFSLFNDSDVRIAVKRVILSRLQ